MSGEAAVRGFSTPAVCVLADVPASTLTSWTRGDDPLVTPSVLGSAGRRASRYWSARDLVIVKAIKALRDAGCPLQQIRLASQRVRDWFEADLSDTVLYWDGHDVVAVDSWGSVYSLIRHPGQQMIHVVALPLSDWRTEAENHREYKEVHVAEIEARRDARRRGQTSNAVRLATSSPGSPTAETEGAAG